MLLLLTALVVSQSQSLVSGAPLGNPDVAVHVVEKKEYADSGKRELTLFPLAAQVNGKFTQHVGLAAGFTWHLHENFGLTAMGIYHVINEQSGFSNELVEKTRVEAQAATSLLLIGGALAGVEVTPLYGKFALYENALVHFSLVLNGMAGAGATRHQLRPSNAAGPATYGSTGWRFMAEVGGGLRVKFAKYFSVRLEVRDILYSAKVDQVNGCTDGDLTMADIQIRGGMTPSASPGCSLPSNSDVPLAKALVKSSSSDVLNNLGVYAGFSLDF
jgi:outer membrane beta-barrel protein